MAVTKVSFSKIPELLIYHPKGSNNYKMFSTKTGNSIGELSVEVRKDLFISKLLINKSERNKGYGTKFLDFAKTVSKEKGLNGRLRVLASLIDNENSPPPHLFYRKYGFTSSNPKLIEQIDDCIAKKQSLPYDFPPAYMYYK